MSAPRNDLPRVLFVGRSRYTLPLPEWLAKKWDALARQIDYRVIGTAGSADTAVRDERFRLLPPLRLRRLDGLAFYFRLPAHARREIRSFRPQAIIAADPYVGMAALLARVFAGRPRPRVIVEVHGDWRTFTRLYGSRWRKVLSPVADIKWKGEDYKGVAYRC